MVSKLVAGREAGLWLQRPHKMKHRSFRHLKQNINVIQILKVIIIQTAKINHNLKSKETTSLSLSQIIKILL